MPNWYKYRSSEAKQARSEKASRAAHARWDAYHAMLAETEPLPFELPEDCYEITVKNLIHNKEYKFLFHPGAKLGSYRVDLNGTHWKTCGFTEALIWIRKACKRMQRLR